MPRAGRTNRELVVIYWRDIPAQINAQEGRDRHQIVLGGKFQRAIDRAKRKAGIYTADEEVAQWRRESRTIDGDLAEEAQAAADAIEGEYRSDRLSLPHEQVTARRFVLIPLLELDFDLRTPDGTRLSDCLARMPLDEGVRRAGGPLVVQR